MGGIALIIGSIGFFLTISFHPSSHDFMEAGSQLTSVISRTKLVHIPAAASLPILFFGALALSLRLASTNRVAIAALIVYGFAMIAATSNVIVDGFLSPSLIGKFLTTTSPTRETWQTIVGYNGQLNEAYAQVFVISSTVAIGLWSFAILNDRILGHLVGIYGLVLALFILGARASGGLTLAGNGFRWILLGQILWTMLAGVFLLRSNEYDQAAEHGQD